ncbi:MAG: hypothetical protein GX376_00425 [Firmicutes bacterium]|nr:hypothetical protein [Bacillota bacterium]
MRLIQMLFCHAREKGIELLGITGAEPFHLARQVVQDRKQQGLYTPFAPANIDRACDPLRVMPGAKSLALRYLVWKPLLTQIDIIGIPLISPTLCLCHESILVSLAISIKS